MMTIIDTRRLLGRSTGITTIVIGAALVLLAVATPPRNTTYVMAGVLLGVSLFGADLFAMRKRLSWLLWLNAAILVGESVLLNAIFPDLLSYGADFILHLLVAAMTQFGLLFIFRRLLLVWLGDPPAP